MDEKEDLKKKELDEKVEEDKSQEEGEGKEEMEKVEIPEDSESTSELEDQSSEHTLEDLRDDEKEDSPSGRFTQKSEIPHLNSLGSRYSGSGLYSSAPKSSTTNKLHLFILILIGIGVIGATVYLLKGTFSLSESPSPTPSIESSVVTSSPAPSPSSEAFARSDFKIRVLNGTSKSGLAASVSAKLKEQGYQVERTGNATNSAFTKTQILVKEGVSGLLDQLIKDLIPDFNAVSAGNLKESDPADAEIILGTE